MLDGSAVFCRSTLSVYLCIWSTLLGSAVLFPSDSGHSVNNLCSGGSHVCLCLPVSIISLCPLSLYLVNVLLSFLSDTVNRYSAILYSLFSDR